MKSPTITRIACCTSLLTGLAAFPLPSRADPAPSDACAATFYVRPGGNDHNSGTAPNRAWKTIARVNQQVFHPGETILFEGGGTFAGNLQFDAADSGRADAPVTLRSFGSGRARLEAGAGAGVSLTNTAGFIVQDLVIHGTWNNATQAGNEGDGILAVNTTPGGVRLPFLRISHVEISGFRNSGIFVLGVPEDGSRSGYEDVRITDTVVHDNGDIGIGSGGPFAYDSGFSNKNFYLARNRVYNTRGLAGHDSHTGNGIVLSDVDGAVIEHCVAFNNGENNDAGAGPYGIWAWDSTHVTIQFNEAHHNKSQTADGGGFDLDGGVTHSVMQYNYSHDNYGPGYGIFQFPGARPFDDNIVRYNLSQNDGNGGVGGILLWDGNYDMGSVDVYHNTIAGPGPAFTAYSALYFGEARFRNNLLVSTGGTVIVAYDSPGLVFQGNDYWTAGNPLRIDWVGDEILSLADFRDRAQQELLSSQAVGFNLDPRLAKPGSGGPDGFKLRPNSPMIDAGLDLSARFGLDTGGRDFFGHPAPRGTNPDIGAHELR